MQSKSKQRAILDGAARLGELPMLVWFAESNRAGTHGVIMFEDGTLPVVPVVLWPGLGCHRDQADLSRLLAELMCKAIRVRLGMHREITPALTSYEEMAELGVAQWEEWQMVEFDYVCPHCGMLNTMGCCADNRRFTHDIPTS